MSDWFGVVLTASLLCGLALSAGGCGCRSEMGAYDVRVEPQSAGGRHLPLEVNLIGVSDADYGAWSAYPVNQYWSPGDPLRKKADRYVMTFSAAETGSRLLKRTDPIWTRWREHGAMHLFVWAFLPRLEAGARPDLDPRKLDLSLDRCFWKQVDELDVVVKPDGLHSATSAPGS